MYATDCMKTLLAALTVFVLCSRYAQSGQLAAPPVAIEAQPITHVRGGSVQGCGVRLTGGQPGLPASSWFDVSLNIFERGVGLAQSIAYELRRSEVGESRPTRVPLQTTWVAPEGRNARVGENSERKDSLIYAILLDDMLALFEAVASEAPLTLGVRRWDQREDIVYTGSAVLTSDARQKMSTCLSALTLR